MDDGALEVTVENGPNVNEVKEQPDDEEQRYWFSCSLHRIAGVDFAWFAGVGRGGCTSACGRDDRNESERNDWPSFRSDDCLPTEVTQDGSRALLREQ